MSISGIGSMSGMAGMQMQGMRQRPDPAQMAENLFDKLDTSGQGYLQKADLQTAFDSLSPNSTSSTSSATANVDEIFAKLDGDSDGKVTKEEFSSSLKKLSEQLDQQFQNMRMQGGMEGMGGGGMGGMGAMGGMPPPPPPGGNGGDEGFSKDELSSQLEEIGSSDSQRSSLISSVVENFDAADTDGNGKVSFQEAMAFQQTQSSSGSTSTSGTASATGSDSASADAVEAKVMLQIMRLMHAYGQQGESTQASSSISVSA